MKIKTIFLGLGLALSSYAANAEVQTSVGDVYEVKTGKLVYREFHTFSKPPLPEFMQTEYKAVDGTLIADRRVNFLDGYASDYVFKQYDPEIEKKVVRGPGQIEYNATDNGKQTEKTFTPPDIGNAVVNAGMFNAVEREWDKLLNGETVKIDLVVPDRGRAYAMNLKRVSLKNSKMAQHQSIEGKVVFNLYISNRLFRLLLAPVELGYDIATRRLVFYQGPSNIRRNNGKKIGDIRINYKNS